MYLDNKQGSYCQFTDVKLALFRFADSHREQCFMRFDIVTEIPEIMVFNQFFIFPDFGVNFDELGIILKLKDN